ncbi:hypothetical protein K4F52_002489 [Lecanicillium sp. MT-2017a]|nr:hypothetical protein K4F52_002489 [Lecanicillium sp. MT-2017a]
MHQKDNDAFDEAVQRLGWPDTISFTTHRSKLSELPESVKFDTIVSPANSYGRLDGAFDDAISRAFSPQSQYLALTRVVQAQLYDQYRGFAPPGTCTLVRIPDEFTAESRNVWGTKHLALCPTMRIPQVVVWDKEVIYECIWTLLCAVDKHNRRLGEGSGGGDETIRTILMTPLATGVGKVSEKRWAAQLVTAVKHFERALVQPETFGALDPQHIFDLDDEIAATYGDATVG